MRQRTKEAEREEGERHSPKKEPERQKNAAETESKNSFSIQSIFQHSPQPQSAVAVSVCFCPRCLLLRLFSFLLHDESVSMRL